MTIVEDLELSQLQQEALADSSARVLVSAGAGSGKTRLLVAYFLQALLEDEVPAQDLVAVTFTRKAAAELVGRIRSYLLAQGRDDLSRELAQSTIGTIHSLCRRLIREHALEALVDPAFTVIEAETAAIIKEEICLSVWAELVEEADEAQLAVLATYEANLRQAIIPVYDRLRTIGQQCPVIRMPPVEGLKEGRDELTSAVHQALAATAGLGRRSAWLDKDLGLLRDCLEWLGGIGADSPGRHGRNSAGYLIQEASRFFPSRKTAAAETVFEPVRKALTSYRMRLAGVEAELLVAVMNQLLVRFHQRYQGAKVQRGVMDFADLELRALSLIRSSSGAAATFFGPQARIMIDEFQDTNELQCAILEDLAPGRLLMVGDERQSIYRFRGADIEVFRRREGDLAAGARGLHQLADNYRSSSQILGFINHLFAGGGFFGGDFRGLDHARNEDGEKRLSGRTVDVLVVDREISDDPDGGTVLIQEAEAETVAGRVRQLIDEGGWEPRDIAILTPALTYSTTLEQALASQRVNTYLVRGKGYYSREEITDVTALLRILVNPRDDLALVTVLRSPLVGLSDDALYLLGQDARNSRVLLWEAARRATAKGLDSADREALADLGQKVPLLRQRVGRSGLAQLIEDAVSMFAYDLCLLSSTEGDRRFANVRKLMRLAGQFEEVDGPDLAGFIQVLQSMGDRSDDEGSAPTLAEGENVVRIMTVHQAKGLEFEVVVLTGLGSDLRQRSIPQFVIAGDGRTAVFLKGTQRKSYEDHDLCWGPGVEILLEQTAQERQEDQRLLYVAMTRARNRLVLVGAKPKDGDMGANRIGRIAAGLGLESFPSPGETIELEGLDAAVSCVAFLGSRDEFAGPRPPKAAADDVSSLGDQEAAPQFLECRPLPVLPRRTSFSGIAAFQECPRRFYLERVLHLRLGGGPGAAANTAVGLWPEEEGGPGEADRVVDPGVWLDREEASAGREVGLLVHGLLERLALWHPCPDADCLGDITARVIQESGLALTESQNARALNLVRAFWRSPFATRVELSQAGKEVPFCFVQNEMVVSGVMDLVWKTGRSWSIVDYKTNALRGRFPEEVAAAYALQSQVYSLAAFKGGATEVSMSFLFLEQPETMVHHTYSMDDAGWLAEELASVIARIRGGDFPAVRGEICGTCSLSEVCVGLR